MQSCDLVSTRGAAVAARFFEPPAGPLRGTVVIGGAMGVRQDYYASFAQWLAGQGYLGYGLLQLRCIGRAHLAL